MSDGRGRGRGQERRAASRIYPESEDFVRLIREIVGQMLDDQAPAMATVEDVVGGGVRVSMDDEDEARELPLPRKLGHRYARGQRVRVERTRSGEWMVTGAISDGQGGEEQVVGAPDLQRNAITNEKLATDAVDTRAILAGAVIGRSVANGAIGTDHLADNIDAKKLRDGTVTSAKIDRTTAGRIDGAAQQADVQYDIIKKSDNPSARVAVKRDVGAASAAAKAADAHAGKAEGIANDAKVRASGAQSTANAAKTAASRAQSDATKAAGDAAQAKSDAAKANHAIGGLTNRINSVERKIPDTSQFATKSQLPNVSGLATKAEVTAALRKLNDDLRAYVDDKTKGRS